MESIIEETLRFAVDNNASDIHISSESPPILRILGELKQVDADPLTVQEIMQYMQTFLTNEQKKQLQKNNEIDLAIDLKGAARFRVNIYKHIHGISVAFRIIPHKIHNLNELRMPDILKSFIKRPKGLILLTGPTGSGKSTTLAAMINEINNTMRKHIITIEDPVEYLHTPNKCLIHQREVGEHTNNFASALRASLREDPDVILVGEMRDLETITNALHAAETGHLVFSTLHTNSAPETIDRIINVFPEEEQQQVRTVLASSLVAVIAQRLVRQALKDDRIALMEIIATTPAVQNLIREGKTYQLDSAIQTGSDFGMQSFEKSLKMLQRDNIVAPNIKITDFI